MTWRILTGDCVEQMRTLEDCSVDAVVCDPPYGIGFMGATWDGNAIAEAAAKDRANRKSLGPESTSRPGRAQPRSSSAYGNEAIIAGPVRGGSDFQTWCEAWATEALRVLKPGGHLLAFGGSRTYHRLASGVEDAGFEIRDEIMWLYGSGFPKSLDVSKAIDKRRDDEPEIRKICRFLRRSIDDSSETVRTIATRFDFHPRMVEHWAARDTDSQPSLPTLEQWDQLRELLDFDDSMDAEVLRLNLRKGEPGEAWADRPITGEVEEWTDRSNYALTSRDGLRRDVAASADAQRWEGWGTALKPAHEPIVVARKPPIGTVAANYAEYRVGGLNIDGCRIAGVVPNSKQGSRCPGGNFDDDGYEWPGEAGHSHPNGRWPANVVLDPEAAEALDTQTGELKSGFMAAGTEREGLGYRGGLGNRVANDTHGDSGGASRFFPTFGFSTLEICPLHGAASIEAANTSVGKTAENSAANLPTDGSGSESTGRSQPDTTSTTETKTPSTTKSPISSCSSEVGISDTTEVSEPGGSNKMGSGAARSVASGNPSTSSRPEPTPHDSPTVPTAAVCTCGNGASATESITTPICGPTERDRNPDLVRFRYCAKTSRGERWAGVIRCPCETFAGWVNEDQRAVTQPASDTSLRRATTEPISTVDSDLSTTGCGNKATDLSPTDSTSTTSTRTSRTTGSRTSPSSPPSTTNECIPTTTAEEPTVPGNGTAPSATNGSPRTATTSISTSEDGCNTAAVGPVTSGSSSSPSGAEGPTCPSCGGFRGGGHPTVKPINLMRWLVRLVTPDGGLVLDPFTGSGSTGCAAVLEGFHFIGCEREPEYVAIAEARIAFWAQHVGREVDDVLGWVGASEKARKAAGEVGQLGLELDVA
jgi:DNA modification methylase